MPSATHLPGLPHSSTSVEEFFIRSDSPQVTPIHSREELLQGVEDCAMDVLSLLRSGDPDGRATEAFEMSMVTNARRHLETRIDDMALGLAEATGRSPDAVKTEVLTALCDLAQSPNVADTRQQLIDRTCVNANGLRLAIHQATASQLHTIEQAILANGQRASEDEPFGLVVDKVRQTYGACGPVDLRASADIEQQVRQLTDYLAPGLAEAFQKFGLSRVAHEADYITTLCRASIILVDHGINTTIKVNRFLTRAQAHDDKVAFATGALGQVGYGAGMGAFMYAVAPKIAPALLGEIGGMGGAIAFGAVAGAMVGYLDCIAGSGASALKDVLSYTGSGPLTSDVARKMCMGECNDIATRAGISAVATFTKNALLRAVVPSVIYAVAFPAGVSRDLRDGIDFAGDAGGGLISGGLANVLNRKALDNRQSSGFKLLAQRNLPQLLQKGQSPSKGGIGLHALMAYARGLGTGAIAPSTFAVTGAVITPMVGLLLGINVGAIPELGLSMTAAKVIPEAMLTTSATSAVSLDRAPIVAAEHALKATVSTLMMSALAFGATGVGHFVGRRADADWLEAVFGTVRRAALLLRTGAAPASEAQVTELTSIRHRTITRTRTR